MKYESTNIVSRIEWCRRQKTQARSQLELEGWQAEEEGLRDALFNSDHSNQYQHSPTCVCGRYMLGLQDGEALIRATAMNQHFATPDVTHGTRREPY